MPSRLLYNLKGPRGYSAYEVAVQEGFVGTQEEWVAFLGGGVSEALTSLNAHLVAERPHANAESGRDFSGWYQALTT